MKLRKGDEITITAGKDKGKKGKIETILPKEQAVLILGKNMYKRHLKRRDEKNPGGIVDMPRPLPVSNIALVCPKCKKLTRVGFSVFGNEKQRICRKCRQIV